MDLRHLRTMLAIIDEGSLSKAARKLNISQPALTKSIHRLEDHLGVRLFERDVSGMKPTLFAQSLEGYARAACIGMVEAERQIAALSRGTEGTITIAATPLIASELLPQVVFRLSQERPKLKVRIVVQDKQLHTELLDGRFTLVIATLYDEVPQYGLVKQRLFDDRLVLVMRPEHPLAKLRKASAKDLVNQKWIFADADSWSQARLKLFFAQSGVPLPNPQVEARDTGFVKSLIMTSDFIGAIPRLGVEREIANGSLKAVEIDSPLMLRPVGLVRRENEPMLPVVNLIVQIIEDIYQLRRDDGKVMKLPRVR